MTQQTTIWKQLAQPVRKRLAWGIWFVTWLGLVGGLFNAVFYQYVVIFSGLHALLFLWFFRCQWAEFPVQVRFAYFLWVALGTYVPYLKILLFITTVGLATNLFWGYCPLARLMSLMPWNRTEPFSIDLVRRVFFSPPVSGRFVPPVKNPTSSED